MSPPFFADESTDKLILTANEPASSMRRPTPTSFRATTDTSTNEEKKEPKYDKKRVIELNENGAYCLRPEWTSSEGVNKSIEWQ